jgi:hypothetical protein
VCVVHALVHALSMCYSYVHGLYVLYMHLYMHWPCVVHTHVHRLYVLYMKNVHTLDVSAGAMCCRKLCQCAESLCSFHVPPCAADVMCCWYVLLVCAAMCCLCHVLEPCAVKNHVLKVCAECCEPARSQLAPGTSRAQARTIFSDHFSAKSLSQG